VRLVVMAQQHLREGQADQFSVNDLRSRGPSRSGVVSGCRAAAVPPRAGHIECCRRYLLAIRADIASQTGGEPLLGCIRARDSTFAVAGASKQCAARTGGGALVSGDASDPFEDFVRDRSEYLFQLALLLSGRNRADAQDLLQVALERAWRRRRAIARNDNPEAYVRRALVNASIDRWRWLRRRDERSLHAAGPGPAGGDPASLVARRDELIRALAALPPRQRAVLVLRYWEDMPEAEVARLLGCSVGTVKSQASRGLARLRELGRNPAGTAVSRAEAGRER
jgi:RNA polymerase sigma-70 factor (sigma-E family)